MKIKKINKKYRLVDIGQLNGRHIDIEMTKRDILDLRNSIDKFLLEEEKIKKIK